MVPWAGAVQIPKLLPRFECTPGPTPRGEAPPTRHRLEDSAHPPLSRLARGACRALTRLEPWSCGPDSKTQIVGQFAILKQRHPPAALEEEVRPPATWHCDLVGYDSLRVSRTIYSCYLGRHFFLEASVGTLARKPRRSLLSRFPRPSSSRGPTPRAGTRQYLPGRRVHDAASFAGSHGAVAAPLQRVVVHPEVVAQLVRQGHGRAKGAVGMVLQENTRAQI